MKQIQIIVIFLLLSGSCNQKDYTSELLSFEKIKNSIISQYDFFLFVPSDYCTDCFQEILKTIETKQQTEQVLFIVSGRNHKEINSFSDNFSGLNYFEEINLNFNRPFFPVIYYKAGKVIRKREIKKESDLKEILSLRIKTAKNPNSENQE